MKAEKSCKHCRHYRDIDVRDGLIGISDGICELDFCQTEIVMDKNSRVCDNFREK